MATRPKLNRLWASTSSTLRRDPGDAKYIQGWISEIPTYQVLNYLQYKVDLTMLAQAERGIFEWGGDVSYGLGSIVWDETDKKIYISTVGSPDKTKVPSTNLTQWAPSSIQISRNDYDTVVAAINAHIANVTGNPHNLTAGRLNAYNKAEIDAIVVQYRALVSTHAADKNNPHGVTATQIGAVPSIGGTYTGDVLFNGGLYFDAGKVNQISKTNGLYLQSGSFVLGINTSGVAVAGTTSSQSPIVTEQTFPTLKAAREPAYAVPQPSFEANLIKSINIKSGVGTFDSSWTPFFEPSSGALLLQSNGSRSLASSDVVIPPNTPFTIAFDVYSNSAGNSDENYAIAVSVSLAAVSINSTNRVNAYGSTGGGVSANAPAISQGWTRIAVTFSADGKTIKIYVNGVLAATTTSAAVTASSPGKVVISTNDRGSSARNFYMKNVRIWQSDELTASQVSSL